MEAHNEVALCSTCLVDQFMPEVGAAAVKVLRRAGCQVDFPLEQTCCGQPFFNSGFRKQAAALATRTIEVFEPYETVVLPSGSCTTMIRKEYPHLLEHEPEWKRRAEAMASKTFELSEFLVEQREWQPPAATHTSKSITYHESCHMKRLLGIEEAPRRLLKKCGLSLREMAEPDRCCGFGGLFSVRMPEVSNAMTAEKLVQAEESEADLLVTADPGCLMQMQGLARGSRDRFQHLAVVLEEHTR